MTQLTPEQLERISQISNPILRQRFALFYQLPQDLQESMFSEQTSGGVWSIIKDKYNLPESSISATARIIGLIFLGEMPIKNFIAEIKNQLKVDMAKAQAIAQDINQAIFQPVRNSLMIVHGINEHDANQRINANDTNRMTNDQAQMSNQVQNPNTKYQQPVKLVPPANEPDYEAARRRNEVLNKLKNPPSGPTAKPARYSFVIPPRRSVGGSVKKKRKATRYNGFFV